MSSPRPRRAKRSRRLGLGLSAVAAGLAALVLLLAYAAAGRPSSTAGPTSPGGSSAGSSGGSRAPANPRVILDDSFDDARLDESVWNTCHWWNDEGCTIASNNELQWYRREQVGVRDGALQLSAVPEPIRASDGKEYPFRSGMVTTGPERHDGRAKLAFTYGKVEARLRVPEGKGLWSAMWLLPANEDSRPEIDVLEVLGQDPRTMIMHLHPENRDAESPSKKYRGPDLSKGWHDIVLDWVPGSLTFSADGKRLWRVTGDEVPSEPMYLVLNLAVGGVYPGDPDPDTAFPATMAIDRVKITAAQS